MRTVVANANAKTVALLLSPHYHQKTIDHTEADHLITTNIIIIPTFTILPFIFASFFNIGNRIVLKK